MPTFEDTLLQDTVTGNSSCIRNRALEARQAIIRAVSKVNFVNVIITKHDN